MNAGHPAVPPPVSRPWIAGAAAVWLVVALLPKPDIEPLMPGRMTTQAVLVGDVELSPFGRYAIADTEEGRILLRMIEDPGLTAGDHIVFDGVADGRPGEIRGDWYRSTVDVIEVDRVQGTKSVPLALGNTLRRHVMHRLQPFDEGRALLAGFLIGDTSRVDPADVEAMRTAGLSHFVAVSGSNVALVLLIVAVVAGPLALGPKRRAVIGLLAIPIYAAATRFEPSVMRASVMAGCALVGRLFGVVLEAWQLMALSVSALVVMDHSLTGNVGFQLSVAATAGVLVGGRWPTRGGPVRRTLAVTIGAQAAVAPLLLLAFGSVPLLSPLVNLLAAPLVAFATVTGAAGVGGFSPLTELGAAASTLVLDLARGASVWPQVGALELSSIALVAIVALRFPILRSPAVVVGTLVVVLSVLGSSGELPDAGVVVLDVGQGDAILIAGGGHLVLVDGGPDPVDLLHDLRRYGVDRLDIVVMTHGDADHAAGLVGLVGRYDIGELWDASEPHQTSSSSLLIDLLSASGVPVHVPTVGETRSLRSLQIEVVAPVRRYKSGNDQSIVLLVSGPERTMLLTGDIETYAQADLGNLRADVLKVPHHGGGTSDPQWLAGVGADTAVISVGENDFGHPVQWVVDVFESSGAEVLRTDELGDIVIDLGH